MRKRPASFTIKPSLLAMLLAFPAQQSLAAACTWNPASGNWSDAGNWSCGSVPAGPAGDSASISAGKTVTVNSAQSIFTLVNAGVINIDAFLLSLWGGGSTTNSGTINVGSGPNPNNAALQIGGGHNIGSTGGVITVSPDSVINQFGSTISGGTISTSGTGALVAYSNGANYLNGVTLNGTLDLSTAGNARERLVNGLTVNGAVSVANGGILTADGVTQTIGGNGTINLNDAGARLSLEGNGNTTLASTVVVRGQGNIGQPAYSGGTHTLINDGRISADVSGGTLNLYPGAGNGSVTNNGTLEAKNGGTLLLSTNVAGNVGSQILAATGSSVVHNGVTVSGVINTSGTGLFTAVSNGNNFLDGVTLNGTLDLTTIGNSRERVVNGLTINGAVNIANGGVLGVNGGNQTIAGSGTINLNDPGARLSLEGNGNTTLASTVVVRGQGNIGTPAYSGGTNNLVNNGRISADVSGGTLNVVPGANGGSVTNNGTLEAINGGTLLLSTNVTGTAGSQISAGAGSSVVQNGVTVSGVINTSGAGVLTAVSSGNNYLDGVTLNGTLDLTTIGNSRERVVNGLTVNGAVNIANGGILAVNGGDQTIAGNGTINLNDPGARLSLEGNGNTTLASTVVVRGQGNVGTPAHFGGTNNLVNNGRISADVTGGTLTIVPGGNSGTLTNNGLAEATNGGTLQFAAGLTVSNASGNIDAKNQSVVLQSNATIVGGTISSSGNGVLRADASSSNYLSGVTLSGVVDLTSAGNARERVVDGLTLAGGRVNVANGGILAINGGDQTIGGTGTINLNDGGARLSLEGNGNTTLGAGVVVRGQGNIGQPAHFGGTNNLINNGRISADVTGGTLTIVPGAGNGTLTNNGLVEAKNGGTLQLASGLTVSNGSGNIDAGDQSTVLQSSASIVGGTISSSGSGAFRADGSAGNYLNGVTLSGVVDLTTAGNSRERLVNGLTLAGGRVNVANGGILAVNGGDQTIGGSGTINLDDGGARLSLEGNGNTTLAAGVVVRGQGNIGQPAYSGGTNNLINNGRISADVTGGTLAIVPGAGNGTLTNNGLVEATNGGTLTIHPALNGNGTLQVVTGGVVNLANTPNTQGQLKIGAGASTLNIGTQNLTITGDYTNAVAGVGNGFDRRAGISGAGQVIAGGDVAQAITGSGVSNGNTANATLTIGNVRVGANQFAYQIANTGTTGAVLRGALQTSVNGGNITDSRLSGAGVTAGNYSTGSPGSNTGDLGVTFTVASAGALAPLNGQVLNLRSNFANIPDQKLNIVLGSGAAAYNAATGSTTPSPVTVATQRVGGTNSAALTMANTAPAGGFSEDLRVSFGTNTGLATNNGAQIGALLAGSSDGTTMRVGIDTSAAGARTGTVSLNYQTAGTVNGVSNGLGVAGAGSQTITVNGNVYQAASGSIVTTPLNFGTVQVGQSVSRNLVIANTAGGPAGFVEDLNASFGSSSGTGAGLISGIGSLSGIRAGTNSSSTGTGSMVVSVNTSAAATVNGSMAVNYFTAGAVNGISNGLGTAAAGSENYGVSGVIQATGNVVDQAQPLVNTLQPIDLGNLRINSVSPQASVSVTNQATGNQQAALSATIAGNASVMASGSFNLLAPGATDPNSLKVGINTGTAGAISGTATIDFVSDASNVGNCAPNCQINLPSRDVLVQGAVYRLANPTLHTPSVTIAARVGDPVAANQAVSISNTSPDLYTEGLKVSVAGATGNAQSNGAAIANLAAQGTSNGVIQVGLASTATAGLTSGSVDLALVSTGAGTTGAADAAVGSASVAVNGRVYTPAVGTVNTGPINFGVVRVGDVVAAREVSVSNTAAVTALNDTLHASLSTGSAGFSAGGSASGLGAGQSNAPGTMAVTLNTSGAGVFNGSAQVAFVSQNPEMSDLALASGSVGLQAQVNNVANAEFGIVSSIGTLTRSGNAFTLDLGNVVLGSSLANLELRLTNAVPVSEPADALTGAFDLSQAGDADGFSYSGWNAFSGLAAGLSVTGLDFSFDALALGLVDDLVAFDGFSVNGFGPDLAQGRTLTIRANVIAGNGTVPEPGQLALGLLAAVAGAIARRRRG